ncbi:hypothetical protein AX17_005236 [Amanita inopinata Kibby_2008]|nr:hypothetical protein AX17_005236 [Amanita inopinata Kibby_2008]
MASSGAVSDPSRLVGIVFLERLGPGSKRLTLFCQSGFYQETNTYAQGNGTETLITPLGSAQEFQLGQLLRSIYIEPLPHGDIPPAIGLRVRADAGARGEGGVIFNSAVSLLQGFYPPAPDDKIQLANGSVITGPLNGYQYIPIESVEPNNDISLDGWTSCGSFLDNIHNFYASKAFKEKEAENQDFINSLSRYLNGPSISFSNIWNIWDFMNVQSTYDKTFHNNLPAGYLEKARDLANWHEYATFTSANLAGIGNIAGRTVLPSILNGFASIVNPGDPVRLVYLALSYKPFLSLFNMTGVIEQNPQLAGIVNYAAAVALEVRKTSTAELVVRFKFKNGTDDSGFTTLNFLGSSGDVPLSLFINRLAPAAINTTSEWCSICSNTRDRGCDQVAAARVTFHEPISPAGAGFLGAGLMLAVMTIALGMLLFAGVLTIGKKRSRREWVRERERGPEPDQDFELSSIRKG